MKKIKGIVVGMLSVGITCLVGLSFNFLSLNKNESSNLDICIQLKSPCMADYYSNMEEYSFSDYMHLNESQNKKSKLKEEHKKLCKKIENKCKSFSYRSDNVTLSNTIYCSISSKDIKKIKDKSIESIEVFNQYIPMEVEENCKAISTISSITKDGIFSSNNLEYSGDGMLIGIIDTGINVTHDAFSNMPSGTPKYNGGDYLTEEVLSNLNIKGDKTGLYRNQKIVYAYDYAEEDKEVSNVLYGSHGYHVAGIAGGNNGKDFYGASKDAQLAIFKVFPDGPDSTASEDCIINAIEDAITIGCDVVNLSLGTKGNYTESSVYDTTINMARKAGMAVIVANGNEGASTKSGADDYSSSDMLDYSTTGSPASTKGAMGVGNCYMNLEKMHETSSWGCLPTMEIKPDITAPGTDIRSAVFFNGTKNEYGRITGTSMASPNIAGAFTNVLQYVKGNMESFKFRTDGEAIQIAENLLMSTAVPIYSNKDKAFVSPRHQGAGVANVERALSSSCYLTDINGFRPKITVGQDPLRTGIYEFSFIIKNVSNKDVSYDFNLSLSSDKINKDGTLAFLPHNLNGKVNLFDGAKKIDKINMQPNSSKIIDVQVILNEEEKEYLIENFKNGAYIDGYLFMTNDNGSISLPFISYFGSLDEMNAFSSKGTSSPKLIIEDGSILGEYGYSYNPYDFSNEEELEFLTTQDDAKNAISFNTKLNKLRFRILRQLVNFNIEIVDLDNGKTIKSYKNMGPGYQKWNVIDAKNNGEDYQEFVLDFNPLDYPTLVNNSRLAIKFEGKLPYYGDKDCRYILPFTIDNEAPIISKIKVLENNIEFVVEDNLYSQCFNIVGINEKNKEYLFEHYVPFFSNNKGQTIKIENIDIRPLLEKGFSKDEIFIEANDFANNIRLEKIQNKDKIVGFTDLEEHLPTFKENLFKNNKEIGSLFSIDGANYIVGVDGYILDEYIGTESVCKVIEGTTSIKSCNSTTLKKVILPSTLKTIQENAFINCNNLEEVVCLSIQAPNFLGENIFSTKPNLTVPYYNVGYNREIYKNTFKNAKTKNCVVLDSFGGSYCGIYIEGEVETPKKDGYEFLYWVNEKGEKIENIEFSNQLLIAKYKSVIGNVTFSFYGGEILKTYQLNQRIIVPQGIIKPFNKVVGYKVNDDVYSIDEPIYYNGENINVNVIYEKIDYNLIYNVNGKKMVVIWREGDSLYEPTKEGFLFDGWYLDSNLLNKFEINENMDTEVELYAKWKVEEKKSGCGSNLDSISIIIIFTSLVLSISIYKKNKIFRSK